MILKTTNLSSLGVITQTMVQAELREDQLEEAQNGIMTEPYTKTNTWTIIVIMPGKTTLNKRSGVRECKEGECGFREEETKDTRVSEGARE
jgi:hypothetical protein